MKHETNQDVDVDFLLRLWEVFVEYELMKRRHVYYLDAIVKNILKQVKKGKKILECPAPLISNDPDYCFTRGIDRILLENAFQILADVYEAFRYLRGRIYRYRKLARKMKEIYLEALKRRFDSENEMRKIWGPEERADLVFEEIDDDDEEMEEK